jgi:uncharacterized protein YndB with AHSA1/START domain
MNSEIVFNKDSDTGVYVMKVYKADVSTLWDYFTKSELIDQWWAPKPWQCETEKMDFRENGVWLYAMKGPDGEKEMALANYGEIMHHRSISWTDAFADDKGKVRTDLPQTSWLIGFTGIDDGTRMTFNLHFNSKVEMNQLIEMGFEEGFKMGLNQLEDIVAKD